MFPYEVRIHKDNRNRMKMIQFCVNHYGNTGDRWGLFWTDEDVDVWIRIGFKNEKDLSWMLLNQ